MAKKKENLTRLPVSSMQADDGQVSRAPVVVVLGHIDHGKTSLLDRIRKTHIAEKESGGITQHVGAYEIEYQDKKITFIDTPGHEAFSAMRSRGAKVADISILVIDGCKGVKAQTKEAISHIKKSQILMIVAINKIDKPEADPGKVKRELAKENILVESMGGKIPSVEVSAKTGKGVKDLLELISLLAEMENLKGDISKPAEGVVIESYLDDLRGPTATLLLRDGVLKISDIVGTFSTFGKTRILENFQGQPIKTALPSMPVILLGFENVPLVGEKFRVFDEIQSAKDYLQKPEKRKAGRVFFIEPGKKVLNLILKTDVLGSIEAIEEVLKNLPQENVILRILKAEAGDINESDVKLAKSARAKILGFRVKTNPIAQNLAERERIKIMGFDIIYDLVQGIRQVMERLIKPELVRENLGKVKILVIFRTEKNRQIVGGKVIEGEVKKGVLIEIFRPASPAKRGEKEEKIGQGKLISLQKNKRDIERAIKGEECGILYEGPEKIEEGDVLLIYIEEKRKREL
ncbi:translation initiation factor IF-2 [Patescibacteria group bacterium]|nr:translation initiation factor IF-2 [Patescibacteria group bacterium]